VPIIWTAFELASLAHANERRVSEGWRPLIHDHQHPHDLFMELVGYDAPLSGQHSLAVLGGNDHGADRLRSLETVVFTTSRSENTS